MKTKNHPIPAVRAGRAAGRKSNESTRLRSFAWKLSGLLFISLCAVTPSSAEAACDGWNVSGKWVMRQSNGTDVSMDVRQNGTTLLGEASYGDQVKGDLGTVDGLIEKINPLPKGLQPDVRGTKTRIVHGIVTGSLEGNRFYMQITWHPTNSVGIYNGQIDGPGTLRGYATDPNKPSFKANWSSLSLMKCIQAPVAKAKAPSSQSLPPPATPAPKKKNFSGGPGNPALASEVLQPRTHTGNAGIRTSPTDIIAPENGGSATALLVWDSGDDHPFATVWLKIDDEEEKMFQPLGQGKRQILVKPGKVYLYIVKDSGERLATATVRARASLR